MGNKFAMSKFIGVEEILGDVGNCIGDPFDLAEEEVEAAQRRHPGRADILWHCFSLLKTTPSERSSTVSTVLTERRQLVRPATQSAWAADSVQSSPNIPTNSPFRSRIRVDAENFLRRAALKCRAIPRSRGGTGLPMGAAAPTGLTTAK